MDETLHDPGTDAAAVAAVRQGDAERYRELVERHERRVFAVAWSRLGDAALAEEATQEAFIRGYRRLWLLGDGAKFSSWIASVARNVAINLGLRHRRELNKRERWALEHPGAADERSPDADTDPLHSPEALRQTLAELPAAHRECLVLFYLEGKSGAEAATALGISEAALRVRLHRARAALRERLEEKLESSLANLRPAKSLVPAIMAGVLASSSAKAATAGGSIIVSIGSKTLGGIAKTGLFAWFFPFISILGSLPGIAFGWWFSKLERRNFRDQAGFRVQLYRKFFRSFLWGFPLLVILMALLNHSALAAWGIKGLYAVSGGFVFLTTLLPARLLAIHRNPFQVGMFAYCVVITLGILALAVGWIPPSLGQLPMLSGTLLLLFIFKYRPARMDYSLFLRASQGMLQFPTAISTVSATDQLNRKSLLAFARFLGSHWLAVNFRWETSGLALRLPPVKPHFGANMVAAFVCMNRHCSFLLLRWDGSVSAHCGEKDAVELGSLKPQGSGDPRELKVLVASAAQAAWKNFAAGDLEAAKRTLGASPESDVFIVSPTRSASTRWMRSVLAGSVALMAVAMAMSWRNDRVSMVNGRFLKPVSVSETEVRTALAQLAYPTNKTSALLRDIPYIPQMCHVLPPTNLFTPEAWQAMDALFFQHLWHLAGATKLDRFDRLIGTSALQGALINNWLTAPELEVTRADVHQSMAKDPPNQRQRRFGLIEIQAFTQDNGSAGYSILDTEGLARTTICLKKLDCLDLITNLPTVQTLLQQQVLSATVPTGRRQNLDQKLLHGMFVTFGYDPIQDTWQALAILEAFGALHWVDRNACIAGILRFHHGKGLFGSVKNGDGLSISGDTKDTLFAFESLRILHALDQVKDLDGWKFRPISISKPATGSTMRLVTWWEIEAWVCQQRLEQIIRERKDNPQAPIRSLLEP